MGGSKGSTEAREPTEIELQYLATQDESLKQAMDLFAKEARLGDEDRRFFDQIWAGGVNPNSPEVKEKVQEVIAKGQSAFDAEDVRRISKEDYLKEKIGEGASSRYGIASGLVKDQAEAEYNLALQNGEISDVLEYDSSGVLDKVLYEMKDPKKSIDSIMFNAAKGSGTALETALGSYAKSMGDMNKELGGSLSGLSKDMISNLDSYSKSYESNLSSIASEYKQDATAATQKYGEFGKQALDQYAASSNEASQQVKKATDKAGQDLGRLRGEYETTARGISSQLGKADQDIEAITRGRELAGISSSVKEAQDNLMSTMSRRGLEGTGVEAGAMSQLASDEARMKSGAYSSAYTQAVGASDDRRMQQLGIAGDIYQSGVSGVQQGLQNQIGSAQYGQASAQGLYGASSQYAGNLYGAESGLAGGIAGMNQSSAQNIYGSGLNAGQVAYGANLQNVNTMYGVGSGLQSQVYQGGTQNIQQNLANLGMAQGASMGIYGGAQNFMNMSGQGSLGAAQQAGNMAQNQAQNQLQFNAQQDAASGSFMQSIGSMAGTAVGAYTGMAAIPKKGG